MGIALDRLADAIERIETNIAASPADRERGLIGAFYLVLIRSMFGTVSDGVQVYFMLQKEAARLGLPELDLLRELVPDGFVPMIVSSFTQASGGLPAIQHEDERVMHPEGFQTPLGDILSASHAD